MSDYIERGIFDKGKTRVVSRTECYTEIVGKSELVLIRFTNCGCIGEEANGEFKTL